MDVKRNPMLISRGQRRRILFRDTKGGFQTVHVRGQEYGEVEPTFINEWFDKLPDVWYLIDDQARMQALTFNKSKDHPRLTDGWVELRALCGLIVDHAIYLRYLSEAFFQMIVWGNNVPRTSFPTWHSLYVPTDPIVFEMDVTQQSFTANHLELLNDFATYLRNETNYPSLYLTGDTVAGDVECDLVYADPPDNSVTIGHGWRLFCAKQRFVRGTRLSFKFLYPTTNQIVMVKIIRR